MKTIEITGASRPGTGKAAVKKVRNSGQVPGTIYGHGEPLNVSVDYNAIKKALFTPETYVVNLDIEGSSSKTVIQEAQYHPVTDKILHVDFLRVNDEVPVEVKLPIKLVGTAKGVLAGGKLVPLLRKLKVRGLVSELPDAVEINITALTLGSTITVGQSGVEGLEITSPSSAGIAVVDIPRAVKQAGAAGELEDGEEGAEGEAED